MNPLLVTKINDFQPLINSGNCRFVQTKGKQVKLALVWYPLFGPGFKSTWSTLWTSSPKCLVYAWFDEDPALFGGPLKTGHLLLILGSIYCGCWNIRCQWLLECKNKPLWFSMHHISVNCLDFIHLILLLLSVIYLWDCKSN